MQQLRGCFAVGSLIAVVGQDLADAGIAERFGLDASGMLMCPTGAGASAVMAR